ncbi:GrpB family protein [Amycolatopsis sp. NPDC049252]|uniref:GrpB family protein n=1 Tax=Amycolatopsis sp. NPDC049252 TaxID=3363933 RepID=UPI0037114711
MVIVSPYNPAWPQRFAEARAELLAVAGDRFTEVEHVGSTSVPGLPAKPIIDVAALAPDLDAVPPGLFDGLGYRAEDFGAPGRLLFVRRDGDVRTHHLHVFPPTNWEHNKERILAAHLRKYPEAALRYGELKQKLAASGMSGDAYTRAKTDLIQELSDAARAERGLPPEPVWEE